MHRVFGLVIAGGLVLGLAPTARAQTDMSGIGGVPAGITTGSQYGYYPGGYNGPYSSANSVYTMAPRPNYTSTYYSSGFYGGVPGTTTYGPGVNYSASTAYPGGTYGYASSYGRVPAYGTYTTPRRGLFRGGLFGRRYGYR
jgi:hypothetical protein